MINVRAHSVFGVVFGGGMSGQGEEDRGVRGEGGRGVWGVGCKGVLVHRWVVDVLCMDSRPKDGGGELGENGGRKGERHGIVVGYPDMYVWREKKRPIL